MTNEKRIEIAILEMETLHSRVNELEAEIIKLRAENLQLYSHAVTSRIHTLRDLYNATKENEQLKQKLEAENE